MSGPAEPGESNVSTEVPDLEEFEQVPEEDLDAWTVTEL